MDIKELKQKIGEKAKDIIISDLSLDVSGNLVDCPYKDHKKGKCINAQWYDNTLTFYCHDCGRNYDIVNFAKDKGNTYKYLCELAGISYKEKKLREVKQKSAIKTLPAIEYIKSRGISEQTINKYFVTSDDKWIYFNYWYLQNGKYQLVRTKSRAIGNKVNGDDKYGPSYGESVLWGTHMHNKSQKAIIITEGEFDAMAMYEIIKMAGGEKNFLCCSLPNGGKKRKWIENCKEFLYNFDTIIFVPDNDDKGGVESIQDYANDLYDMDLMWIDCIKSDVNDLLLAKDINPKSCLKNIKKLIPKLEGISTTKNIAQADIKNGMSTGFHIHDYNDNGLREGCLTLVTGRSGGGKTTYTRQILIALAKAKLKSYMYVGETTIEKEKNKLARYCVIDNDELNIKHGTGGRPIYMPRQEAVDRYENNFGDYIYISDRSGYNEYKNKRNKNISMFDYLMQQMEIMVKHYGVKLFVLDNLMVMCQKGNTNLLQEQKQIIDESKQFAERTGSHVMIIAHPKKGEGNQDISGAQEIVNLADTVVRYVRIYKDQKEKILKYTDFTDEIKKRISAMLLFEKAREDGTDITSFFEWDEKLGALYNLSSLDGSDIYEREGMWTKQIHKYSEDYRPN